MRYFRFFYLTLRISNFATIIVDQKRFFLIVDRIACIFFHIPRVNFTQVEKCECSSRRREDATVGNKYVDHARTYRDLSCFITEMKKKRVSVPRRQQGEKGGREEGRSNTTHGSSNSVLWGLYRRFETYQAIQ